MPMTWPEFKKKWARYSGKESSAYQEHFNDLCQLLGQPTPAEADPTGSESFCFQNRKTREPDTNPSTGERSCEIWASCGC